MITTASENQIITFSASRTDHVETLHWETAKTAVIICDMWDRHTCKSAEKRITALAPKINEFVKRMRDKGVLIIHAPSSVMAFYKGTPERTFAENAPHTESHVPIAWNDLDLTVEDTYPVSDADWCDDIPKCPIAEIETANAWPWTRQISSIEILHGDAISDDGQEIYNILESRGIANIIMTGVHINRCVLGRPFGIRQMIKFQKNVVLIRDLTDGLVDTHQPPYPTHDQGVDLLIKHVEKYWCPSTTSSDVR